MSIARRYERCVLYIKKRAPEGTRPSRNLLASLFCSSWWQWWSRSFSRRQWRQEIIFNIRCAPLAIILSYCALSSRFVLFRSQEIEVCSKCVHCSTLLHNALFVCAVHADIVFGKSPGRFCGEIIDMPKLMHDESSQNQLLLINRQMPKPCHADNDMTTVGKTETEV